MQVCDRCLAKETSPIMVIFEKKKRRMISVKSHLCEQCITEYMKAFGYFKLAFMKEGNKNEPSHSDSQDGVPPTGPKEDRQTEARV